MPRLLASPKPKKRKYYINEHLLIKMLVLLPSGLLGSCLSHEDASPAPTPTFVQAAVAAPDQAAADAVTGVVESQTPMIAGSISGGRVISVSAQVGETVRTGQILAVIDSKVASLRAAQADAEVRRTAAQAHDRIGNATRVQQMAQGGTVSDAERSAAAADANSAAAALAAARAAAAAAHHEVSQSYILSPGTGVIAKRSVSVGSVAMPGQALFEIDEGKGAAIIAAVPQRLANTLQPGRVVIFTGSGLTGKAKIVGISPRVEDGGVVPVRLAIVDGQAASGTVVTVALSSAQGASHLGTSRVPVGAMLTARDGTRYVYTIETARSGHGKIVHRLPVELVGVSGVEARVRAPALIGRQVVSAGGAFLQSGQRVQIVTPGT